MNKVVFHNTFICFCEESVMFMSLNIFYFFVALFTLSRASQTFFRYDTHMIHIETRHITDITIGLILQFLIKEFD